MNKLTKRLLSLAVVVVMVMAMMPTVFAEEPAYTDWDGDAAALVDGAYLKLTDDLVVTERYTVQNKTVTIDLNGKKVTSTEAIQLMYITTGGDVTLKNGTIEMPGLASDNSTVMGGLIQANSGAVSLTLDNVTVTKTGATTGLTHAGILYSRIPTLIKNSTLQVTAADVGGASQEGGLIKISSGCTLTIDNSTLIGTKAKYGGCIFITGSGKTVINSGSVTGGTATSYGDDIYDASNAVVEINGGEVGNVYTRGKSVTVNGGTLGSWTLKAGTMTIGAGVTTYSNPNAVASGCEAYVMDKSGEKTKYTTYADFDAAVTAAVSGNTVSLLADVTTGEVVVPAGVTLNLYGKTLTADAVNATAEGAQIKDEKSSKNAGGKLICDSVSVSKDNVAAPVYYEGAYHFQKFKVAEKFEGNVYKFYLSDALDTVYLDDVWANGYGNSGLKLEICASYKVSGEAKEKTFDVSDELIKLYAADWENKMFVLTITSDMTNITDLVFTARVVVA